MKTIIIELEFKSNEVTKQDVYNYLNELIQDESLSYNIT